MSTYVINHQELHIRDDNRHRNAPIALLIHGWSSSWFTWTPLLPVLSTRYACMAVDLPGYGRSPAPRYAPSIVGYADLMAQLIEQVSDRPVVVLGHSMGGQISIALALRHPQLVERLVLLNPVISGRLSTFIKLFIAPHIFLDGYRWSAKILSFLEKTPISYVEQLMKPILFAERAIISHQDYDRIKADARRPGQGAVRAACYEAMRKADLRGNLGNLETPAMVIWGAEDNTVPLRDAGSVAAEWPAADLRLIPNAGHWPQFEQYDTTVRYLAAYLGLPILSGKMTHSEDGYSLDVAEIAQFLTNTELGQDLNESQRLRIAGLSHVHHFAPNEVIAIEDSSGDELFLVQDGQVDVLVRINHDQDDSTEYRRINILLAGQVAGEMALIQGKSGRRSADLRAGRGGATVLAIDSNYLFALFEDDPALGFKVMQNLARSLVQRLRVQTWQLQLAEKRAEQLGQAS